MSSKKPSDPEPDPAREIARLRGDLLTIGKRVNHDLRTPLGGMVTTGEILKEILVEQVPASASLTDSIFNSADEMTHLLKQISIVVKATGNPLPKETVNMGCIVSPALQRVECRLLKRGATVSEPRDWPDVQGVAEWLEYIWWNFLANSIQHGGPKITLGWQREETGDQFWIADNGEGVPPSLQLKLFQPFDSLHQPDSSRGFGLSVIQRLVELQGGRCGYDPAPGNHRFFFTLPRLPDPK